MGGGSRAGQGVLSTCGAASQIDCCAVCVDQRCGAQGHFAAAFEFKNLSTGRIWAGKVVSKASFRKFPPREKVRAANATAERPADAGVRANSE